jgi:FkbM family methyltransferase
LRDSVAIVAAARSAPPAAKAPRVGDRRQLVVETRLLLDIVATEMAGYRFWVRAESRARRWDEEVASAILEGDEYALEPLRQAGHQLRTVLDVGAHLGAFTLKVKRYWPAARIIAVEPDPDSAALLEHNTAGLAEVSIFAGALLGRAGVRHALLRQGRVADDRNAAASRIAEVVEPLRPPAEDDAGRAAPPNAAVPAEDVLALLDRHGNPEIDLLKLDCEGAEGEILERLAAADRMRRVGWLRGEWHYLANLPRLEAALAPTHIFHIHRGDTPWGAFIAHRKPGISAG